jgi:hypothetical protein
MGNEELADYQRIRRCRISPWRSPRLASTGSDLLLLSALGPTPHGANVAQTGVGGHDQEPVGKQANAPSPDRMAGIGDLGPDVRFLNVVRRARTVIAFSPLNKRQILCCWRGLVRGRRSGEDCQVTSARTVRHVSPLVRMTLWLIRPGHTGPNRLICRLVTSKARRQPGKAWLLMAASLPRWPRVVEGILDGTTRLTPDKRLRFKPCESRFVRTRGHIRAGRAVVWTL